MFLRQACRDSLCLRLCNIRSPSCSPPMCGVAWRMVLKCSQQRGGTVVGLGAVVDSMPEGMFYKFTCTLSWGGVVRPMSTACLSGDRSCGIAKYFDGLPPMAGDGWDKAAWAAAGLPAAGEMLLQLHVHSVE